MLLLIFVVVVVFCRIETAVAAKTCDRPEHPKNGHVVFSSLNFRSRLTFKCDEGYLLQAKGPVFCTSNGTWHNADVLCVAKTCDRPKHPRNGQVEFTSLNFGSQLSYKCNDGYLLNINEPVFCMSDGTWNKSGVRCVDEKEEECSVPWIWNGHIEETQSIYNDRRLSYENVPVYSVLTEGSNLYLVCQNDHLVTGLGVSRTSINCFEGEWIPDAVCPRGNCSVPWIPNGFIEVEIYHPYYRSDWRLIRYENDITYKQVSVGSMPPENTTLFLVCQEDHFVLGLDVNRTEILCSEGKWTPQPVCLKRSCSVPIIRDGRLDRLTKIRSSSERRYHFKEVPVGGRAEDSEELSFVCNQDYTPVDIITEYPLKVICKDGEWSRELRCKRYRRIVVPYVTSKIPMESASDRDKEILVERLPKATQTPPTTPKQSRENCSCTYNSHDRKLSAAVNGVGLWFGDKVKKGDIATLRCQNQENSLVLPNGISSSGSLRLSCDACRIWEDSDLPSCKVVHSANPVELVTVGDRGTIVGASSSQTPNPVSSTETISAPGCLITDLIETTPLHVMPEIESAIEKLHPVGSEVPLMCENSLVLTGDKKAKCGARGIWEYRNALCILGCNSNDDSPSLIMEPAKEYYRFGEFISLKCPPGQDLTSNVERIMCIGTNIWSDQFPECRAKDMP